jgi:hypothetical protein
VLGAVFGHEPADQLIGGLLIQFRLRHTRS